MLYRKCLLALLLTVAVSIQARAEAGWTGSAQIVSLETNIFGRVLVEMETRSNPSGCREKNLYYREITGTGSNQMVQLLIEAAAQRTPVRLRVTGICHLKGYSEFSAAAMVP